MSARRRQSRGQTLLEFALVLPIFLALMLVLFDLGRVTFYYSSINNAAREGARYGIIYWEDTSDIEVVAENAALGVTGGVVNATATITGPAGDEFVTVIVTYTFIPATPFVANLIGGGPGITLSSQAQMLVE